MPVTTPPPALRRSAPGRTTLVLALAALLLSACSGGGSAPPPLPAPAAPSSGGTAAPAEPSTPESSPGAADLPAGWSSHDVEGLDIALPPGVVEMGRKSDQGDLFVRYDNGAQGGQALVIVVVRTGAQLPFKILDDGQTAKANSTLGQEPTTGPETLPVPGTSNSSLTTWMWTDDKAVPRRTTYAYLQGRPAPRYFIQLGGPQRSWPQDRVDTLMGSLSVDDGAA